MGEWALDKFVYKNSEFAIRQIEVQTDGVIAPDQLRRLSLVKPGENLIALHLAAVKRNLELVPTIGSVSIERILPRTLQIRVTERRPVAQVNVPRMATTGGITVSVFQLDADGYVMQPIDPRLCVIPLSQVNEQLPVIVGLNVYELQFGRRVESPQVRAALQLVAAFDHSPMAGFVDLRRIDVSSPGVVVATTEQGGRVTFSLDNLDRQLRRWREIYDLGQRMNKVIATLDLAVSNNVPVRWIEASTLPVTAPKSVNPAHVRRDNV
jgi:cell division protein FtsQ